MRLFSNRSQMTLKCGGNKKVEHKLATWKLYVFLIKKQKFVNNVIYASVLQYIKIENQSKREKISTYCITQNSRTNSTTAPYLSCSICDLQFNFLVFHFNVRSVSSLWKKSREQEIQDCLMLRIFLYFFQMTFKRQAFCLLRWIATG